MECRLVVPLGAVIMVNAGFLGAASIGGGGGGDAEAIVDARGVASLSMGLLLTVALGQYVRSRRDRAEAAERRAEAAERLCIARELRGVPGGRVPGVGAAAAGGRPR